MSGLQGAMAGGRAGNKAIAAARRSSMRSARVALAGLGLLCACTEGGAVPDTLELAEAAQRYEEHAGYAHQPERQRLIEPGTQPRLELVLERAGRHAGGDDDLCPFVVEFHRFPAISEDAATLVQAARLHNDNAGELGERMELTWLDADATHIDEIYNRLSDQPWDHDWDGCDASIERVRERVAAVNKKLEQRVWRSLEPLDAFFSDPGFAEAHEHMTGYEDAALASLAGDDRPIEVYWRNDEFVARIRGMKVLQKTARPGWRLPYSEMCGSSAAVAGLAFDQASGVALVIYNHSSGGCMCDDNEKAGRVELTAEFMAAIEQRSTAPMRSAMRVLAEADAAADEDEDDGGL